MAKFFLSGISAPFLHNSIFGTAQNPTLQRDAGVASCIRRLLKGKAFGTTLDSSGRRP
jgi:hypothetical protein